MSIKKRLKWGNSSSFNKRGQITIFIIVGIIILFVSAGILYITKSTVKEEISAAGEPIIESVPQTFQSIQSYTENCLDQVAKRGLLILGEQGGYIYPDLVGRYSALAPTDADGINLEPLKIPYWHYNSLPNNDNQVAFSSLKPELYLKDDPEMSIEAQLSRFVREKLNDCLGDYTVFETQGFEIVAEDLTESASPEVVVNVGEETVNFWLKMLVEASKGEANVEMKQFYVKVPLRLKHFYEVASEITLSERNHTFLETTALELIQIYGQTDSDKIPPTSAVTFDSINFISWDMPDVKDKIKSLLTSHVPMLRYLSGDNFYRYEYPVSDLSNLYQKTYDNMIIPLQNAEDVEVAFDYFAWEPFVDLNEGEQLIKPNDYLFNSPLELIPFSFGYQQYYNTYDLSFPVLVSVKDPAAFGGKGYVFNFALEANVVNNYAAREEYIEPKVQVASKESMLCDEDKRDTELIKTVVIDSFSKEPLELVKIGFTVTEQDTCVMGLTGDDGKLETEYPAAYGGMVEFMKEGYLTDFYPIDTYEYKENPGIIGYAISGLSQQVVQLHRLQPLKVNIEKKTIEKCVDGKCYSQGLFGSTAAEDVLYSYAPELQGKTHAWTFVDVAKPLTNDEEATIFLRRVSDSNLQSMQEPFSVAISTDGGAETEVSLVPGIYEVKGLLTTAEPLLIPAEERCTGGVVEALSCWDVDGCCFTFDEIYMEERVAGQLAWDFPSVYLTITPEQLYTADEITFYMLSENMGGVPEESGLRIMEDLQVGGKLGNFSSQKKVRRALEPTFS